ncbi:MAG TPA: RecX family transcriptional regulator [Verrucomicrobiae bacterium]|nr:RecX family transcriptional regulator [Verrucomicrobiae bacterium]
MKVTAIKQQVKRQDRYSIYIDDVYTCSLSESALIESRLASGQELDAAQVTALKEQSGLDRAYNNALRYVVMRPRSEWELADYFRRKKIDEQAAQQVTERLRSLDLMNDLTFARSWVANRRLLKSTSKRKLTLELKQKHVAESIIQQVLAEDESDDREQLRTLIEKKRARYPDDQKLLQYLLRQGFSYEDSKAAIGMISEED